MNESRLSDEALAELLTLTVEVCAWGETRYRNNQGQLHRIHGPAVIWPYGSKDWYLDGKKHRTDGPAIVWPNGDKRWYLDDERLTEEEFHERIKTIR